MSAPAVATLQLYLGNRAGFYEWITRGIDERDPFALSLGREFLGMRCVTNRSSRRCYGASG